MSQSIKPMRGPFDPPEPFRTLEQYQLFRGIEALTRGGVPDREKIADLILNYDVMRTELIRLLQSQLLESVSLSIRPIFLPLDPQTPIPSRNEPKGTA